jgi:hypothetical protein
MVEPKGSILLVYFVADESGASCNEARPSLRSPILWPIDSPGL